MTGGIGSEFEEAGALKEIASGAGFRKATHQAWSNMIEEEGRRPKLGGLESRQDGLRMFLAVSFHDMPSHERDEGVFKVNVS